MDAFLWSQPFFTGFEAIDTQHRRLVELINELGGLMAGGDEMSEGRMQILFKQLADYAREHFREEEDLMRLGPKIITTTALILAALACWLTATITTHIIEDRSAHAVEIALIEGGHDWAPWQRLWGCFLDAQPWAGA